MLKDVLTWVWQSHHVQNTLNVTHGGLLSQDRRLGEGGRGSTKVMAQGESGKQGRAGGGANQTWEANREGINNNNKMKQPEATMVLQKAETG